MACFGAKLKAKCAMFLMIVGGILLVLGLVICTYGYLTLGKGAEMFGENDYVDFNVGNIAQMIALAAGVLCMLTGILGILTAYCRNSGFNCFFSFPYMIIAFITGILMLIVAGIASGQAGDQMKSEICQAPFEDGTVETKIRTEYTKLVDKLMCAPDICECPQEADIVQIWGNIPEEKLRSYGRIASAASYTADEIEQIALNGPYDAPVITFDYDVAANSVRTYKECYDTFLKPKFEAEKAKPEADQDPQLKTTIQLADLFFGTGGFQVLQDFEKELECASLCAVPLFYLSKDVKEGPPTNDCVSAAIDSIGSNTGPAIACAVTGLLLLISISSGFVLCSKTDEKDMMNDNHS